MPADDPITRGRPTSFDQATADEICRQMADGASLRQICRTDGFPGESTVRYWAIHDTEGFSAQYEKARLLRLEKWSEEILEISDDGSNDWMERETRAGTITVVDSEHIQRSRLRVDTRKWLMSKIAPKKYGDRTTTEVTGANGGPLEVKSTASFDELLGKVEGIVRAAVDKKP